MRPGRTRFLPKALASELRNLPWRLIGLSLVFAAGAGWLALMSWSYSDPSPNNALTAAPRNWLGRSGAGFADSFMEAFGLSSPLLLIPLAALGIRIASGVAPLRWRAGLLAWLAALLTTPAFFACLPVPSRWMLATGLGGVTGDFIAVRVTRLAHVLPGVLVWPVCALALLVLSCFLLLQAAGIGRIGGLRTLRDERDFPSESALFPDAARSAEEASRPSKFTSFAKRLLPSSRALVPAPAKPREFWMTSRKEPVLPQVRGEPKKKDLARNEPAPNRSPSPFANWGRPSAASAAAFGTSNAPEMDEATGSNATAHEAGEDIDDHRIEPFFGPRKRSRPKDDGGGAQQPGPSSPFRRLAGKMAASTRIEGLGSRKTSIESRGNGGRYPYAGAEGRGEQDRRTAKADRPGRSSEPNLPPLSLLSDRSRRTERPGGVDAASMQRAVRLMSVLAEFGVKGKISGIHPGPVITMFELEPAKGTKSSRVIGLADDIARSMSAVSARIAIIAGKNAIGIELPNQKRELVLLREILESPEFQESQAVLPLALGKSIGGEPIVADLARMPHLLIAGTTGSGKSVGLNAMILSLLCRLPASQCNFIMIDPKMLELSVYQGIPHLLCPVVTDPLKAVTALKWAVREMGSRYERMSKLGVRNIASYNAKTAAARLSGRPLRRAMQTGFHPATGSPLIEEEFIDPVAMPYLVIVIDEMADLMMVAGKDVEFAVQRLSQMARAAGIHLIMATQRPSVDVVTGTIKANFPSRISFQVASKIDSRTIIGEQGAEQLLGAGDMLYMPAGSRIFRAHGPFVSDDEVEAVVQYLKEQGMPSYRHDILDEGDFNPFSEARATGPV